jgi:hypothetical protein
MCYIEGYYYSLHNADPPVIISVFTTSPFVLRSSRLRVPFDHTGGILFCLALNLQSSSSTLVWHKNTASGRVLITSDLAVTNNYSTAALNFKSGFQSNDAGSYSCSIDGKVTHETTIFTLEVGDPPRYRPSCTSGPIPDVIQIRVLGTRCNEWSDRQKQAALSEFKQSITGLLALTCGSCSDDLTVTEQLVCSGQAQGAILVKGMLDADARGAYCALFNFHHSESTVAIYSRLFFIDQTCRLTSSLMGPECSGYMGEDENIATIAGSTSGIVIIAITALVVVIIIVLSVSATNRRYVCSILLV